MNANFTVPAIKKYVLENGFMTTDEMKGMNKDELCGVMATSGVPLPEIVEGGEGRDGKDEGEEEEGRMEGRGAGGGGRRIEGEETEKMEGTEGEEGHGRERGEKRVRFVGERGRATEGSGGEGEGREGREDRMTEEREDGDWEGMEGEEEYERERERERESERELRELREAVREAERREKEIREGGREREKERLRQRLKVLGDREANGERKEEGEKRRKGHGKNDRKYETARREGSHEYSRSIADKGREREELRRPGEIAGNVGGGRDEGEDREDRGYNEYETDEEKRGRECERLAKAGRFIDLGLLRSNMDIGEDLLGEGGFQQYTLTKENTIRAKRVIKPPKTYDEFFILLGRLIAKYLEYFPFTGGAEKSFVTDSQDYIGLLWEQKGVGASFEAVMIYDKLVRWKGEGSFGWLEWNERLWRTCESRARLKRGENRGNGMGGERKASTLTKEERKWGRACFAWVKQGECTFMGGKEACKFEHRDEMKGVGRGK
jgi:hypothetical protein